jgi:hypothetical protein
MTELRFIRTPRGGEYRATVGTHSISISEQLMQDTLAHYQGDEADCYTAEFWTEHAAEFGTPDGMTITDEPMTAAAAIAMSSMNAAIDTIRHGALYETPQNPPRARWTYSALVDGVSRFCESPTLSDMLTRLGADRAIWLPMERPTA